MKISQVRLKHYIQQNSFINIKIPSQYCCGCGKSFKQGNLYKDHTFKRHDGMFIKGSTHYISISSLILLPVTRINDLPNNKSRNPQIDRDDSLIDSPTQIQTKFNQSLDQGYFAQENYKKRNLISNEPLKVQEKVIKKRKYVKRQKDKENLLPKTQKVVWNGFVLIPNPHYSQNDFFCGNCNHVFQNQKQLIMHALNQCFELQHTKSSHFIKLNEQVNQRLQNPAFQPKQETYINTKELNLPRQTLEHIHANYQTSIPMNLVGILSMITNKKKYDEQPFLCGCGKVLLFNKNIMKHMTCHHFLFPINSSHILVQAGSYSYDPFMIRLKVQSQSDSRQIWSCACRPESKMNRQTFVKHVMIRHKGISPLLGIWKRR